MLKRITVLVLVIITCLAGITVYAENADGSLVYKTYTYDNNNRPYVIPAAYTFSHSISGEKLGVGSLTAISDLYYGAETKCFYITDSANNRIVVTNEDFEFIRVIDSFVNNGVVDYFKEPRSVFLLGESLYIADTSNSRIVRIKEENGELLNIYSQPEISAIGSYSYFPMKVNVDDAGRATIH